MTYTVRCVASNGAARDLRVTAPNETAACYAAVQAAQQERPDAGRWYPAYALEA